MTNTYSKLWFQLFLETQPNTQQETAFVIRNLPNPPYRRVLDLCCGQGRHAVPLAEAGYAVVGVDRDVGALSQAREYSKSVTFIQKDMRRLEEVPGTFDAVLSMWQSFGYFDEPTNRDVLRQISEKLTPHGRLILDLYHRRFFEEHQGSKQVERKGIIVSATNRVNNGRLTAHLNYSDGMGTDTFEWQLYTPEEICKIAASFDLHCCLLCTDYDEQKPATSTKPRMQLVFERRH